MTSYVWNTPKACPACAELCTALAGARAYGGEDFVFAEALKRHRDEYRCPECGVQLWLHFHGGWWFWEEIQ